MTEFLTLEDLLQLTDDLHAGPVQDLGLLSAAAARPTTTLWGEPAYLSIDLKTAALLDSLVNNHPLIDGNKRLGWLAVVTFCALNDIDLNAPFDDAFHLVTAVATNRTDIQQATNKLREWHEVRSGR